MDDGHSADPQRTRRGMLASALDHAKDGPASRPAQRIGHAFIHPYEPNERVHVILRCCRGTPRQASSCVARRCCASHAIAMDGRLCVRQFPHDSSGRSKFFRSGAPFVHRSVRSAAEARVIDAKAANSPQDRQSHLAPRGYLSPISHSSHERNRPCVLLRKPPMCSASSPRSL